MDGSACGLVGFYKNVTYSVQTPYCVMFDTFL